MSSLSIEIEGRHFKVGPDAHDLSIPTTFGEQQLECFGAPPARARALEAGSFVGDVRRGGSCNCATYTLTPHCNGTHTECVGHITGERLTLQDLRIEPFSVARLISVQPQLTRSTPESTTPRPQEGDLLLTRAAIAEAAGAAGISTARALVIRTLPNDSSKRTRRYSEYPAPYFTAEAMQWIVEQGIEHLVVDLPSLDRAEDQGHLAAHRIFWNVPPRAHSLAADTRREATITELAYIRDDIVDGFYLLNLQIAPFAADAAPSRPTLMVLSPA